MNTTNTTNTAAASFVITKHYAKRDPEAQGDHYINHVSAMTGEGLHAKSDIAAELAHRDIEIDRLRAALAAPAQAMPPANVDSAPLYLNLNDRAMWVLGWNACLDKAHAAQGGHA